jgi:drug/metabolite transporter (DMT)-like permease
MPTEVMLLVLLGALLHAAWNASIRAAGDKFAQMVALTFGSALIAAAALPFLPLPAPEGRPFIAASVLTHFVYFTLVARAYEQGELSVSYPLMRGTAPLLVALVSMLFLHEPLSETGWLALLLLSGGLWVLAAERRGSVGLALANAGVIAAYTLIDGSGARLAGVGAAGALSYTLWMFLLNAVPFLAWVLLVRDRRRQLPAVAKAWWRGLVGGALALASYGLAIWAMTRAPIPLVAALRETAVIFGLVIGAVVLKERFGPARWLATLLVAAGAVVLRLA